MFGCSNDNDEILPNLFLGNYKSAIDREFMDKKGITLIINVTKDVPIPFTNIRNYRIPLDDYSDTDNNNILSRHLNIVLPMIYNELMNGGKVFVHCMAGINRSASVIVAYLIKYKRLNMNDAIHFVISKRPCIFMFGTINNFKEALTKL